MQDTALISTRQKIATTINQEKTSLRLSQVEGIVCACNTIDFERDQWSYCIEETDSEQTHDIQRICISGYPTL